MNKHHNYDGIIALGGGNQSEGGPTSSTHITAMTVARFAQENNPTMVVASGYGPNSQDYYPISEAEHIARVVSAYNPGINVLTDSESTTTFENLKNIRTIIDSKDLALNGLANWLIVAGPGHAKRAHAIAKIALPSSYNLNYLETDEKISLKDRSREKAQLLVTKLALADARTGNYEDFVFSMKRYEKMINRLKNNTAISKTHSGRK